VADLQRRLAALGYVVNDDRTGGWGPATETAVRLFQERKGLKVDGRCGNQTWNLVVEAGYHLGDRRLYQRKPMMRGDDIADLQRRLGAMGFDAGKVDGIFGPDTAAAVADFQRNAGLTVDGIFGPDELRALERVGSRGDAQVAELRELAALRWSARTLDDRIFAVAERGGLDALVSGLGRRLSRLGANALVLHHPDGSQLAAHANAAGAELFVEMATLSEDNGAGCRCAFYRTEGYASPAGRRLAELIQGRAAAALEVPALGLQGMVVPVLRETRMPAVVCELGPSARLVERAPAVVGAVADAVVSWATCPPA
jgi:N-acetylmuramoyl-L-alanine amidase